MGRFWRTWGQQTRECQTRRGDSDGPFQSQPTTYCGDGRHHHQSGAGGDAGKCRAGAWAKRPPADERGQRDATGDTEQNGFAGTCSSIECGKHGGSGTGLAAGGRAGVIVLYNFASSF